MFDLCANLKAPLAIPPHETRVVPAGISVDIPDGYSALVCVSKTLASRQSLTVLNSPSIIKNRSSIEVVLVNMGNKEANIEPGQRVAQILVLRSVDVSFIPVAEFSVETEAT
jgi:dUTP pyrophosphatase